MVDPASSVYIVDAHALLWLLADDKRLGEAARSILNDENSRLVLPAIALAEACWIAQGGKSPLQPKMILDTVLPDDRYTVHPLDAEIVRLSQPLSVIREMHDRQIVATALWYQNRGEKVFLLTRDANIAESGYIPAIWQTA